MALTSEDIWQKFDLTSNNSTATNSQAVNSNHCHSFESILKPTAMLSAVNSTAVAAATNSSSRTATSISKIMDTDSLVVPDIGDILSDTNLDLDINLDGGIDMDFDYLLDDFLSTKEPLRYDCMWSGERDPMLMNLNNGASNMKASCPGNGTVASEETVIPCSNLDITAGVQSMSCFDTPLSSETSDLDETSSDLEGDVYIQRTSCADRLLPCSPDSAASDMSSTTSSTSSSPVHFFSDHSYVATTRYNCRETTYSPTCVAASNHDRMETHDNEIQSSSSVKSKSSSTTRTSSIESTPGQQNAFRIPAYPTSKTLYKSSTTTTGSAAGSNNSLIKLPAVGKKNSQAKFKFQVKFKSKGVAKSPLMLAGAAAASSSGSRRSLLRSTHVRSPAARNLTAKQLLAMTSNKSLQVSKTYTQLKRMLCFIQYKFVLLNRFLSRICSNIYIDMLIRFADMFK